MSREGADIFFFAYVVFLLLAFAVMIRDPFDPMRPALHSSQPSPRAILRHSKVTVPIHSPPTHLHINQTYHPPSPGMVNELNIPSRDRYMYEEDGTTVYSPISATFQDTPATPPRPP